jgi:5,10-methylenetetrahydromethanopterin reductase
MPVNSSSRDDDGRLALGFLAQPGLRDMVRVARAAEERGFEAAFVAETQIRRDAVTAVTAILMQTSRLRVGTAAVSIYTRGAALLAVTWATLAEAAPGRTILGLGVGSASVLERQGVEVTHPIGRLREYTEAIRAMWSQQRASYDGAYVRIDDAELEVRPDPAPPIFHCVGGPQALRTAARHADGVILDGFLPRSEVARMVRHVHDAAGGRFDGDIGAGLMVSVGDDWSDAADRLRPTVAVYVSRFPELTREMGVDEDVLARIAEAAARDGAASAGRLVSDDLVDLLAVCGSPGHCRGRIDEYRRAGVTLPVLFPEPFSVDRVVAELAPAPH